MDWTFSWQWKQNIIADLWIDKQFFVTNMVRSNHVLSLCKAWISLKNNGDFCNVTRTAKYWIQSFYIYHQIDFLFATSQVINHNPSSRIRSTLKLEVSCAAKQEPKNQIEFPIQKVIAYPKRR